MDRDRRRLAVFVAVTTTVVVASLVPGPTGVGGEPTPDVAPPGADLLVHALGYAAVAYTLARALPRRVRDGPDRTTLAAVVVATVAVGAGVELAQGAVPGRSPSALDGVANAVGAVAGAAWWWRRTGGGRGDEGG